MEVKEEEGQWNTLVQIPQIGSDGHIFEQRLNSLGEEKGSRKIYYVVTPMAGQVPPFFTRLEYHLLISVIDTGKPVYPQLSSYRECWIPVDSYVSRDYLHFEPAFVQGLELRKCMTMLIT